MRMIVVLLLTLVVLALIAGAGLAVFNQWELFALVGLDIDPGYVMLSYSVYTLETSLWMFLVLSSDHYPRRASPADRL